METLGEFFCVCYCFTEVKEDLERIMSHIKKVANTVRSSLKGVCVCLLYL